MNRETRTDFQVYSALGMLVAGVGLSVAGFCVPPVGEISDSVLWFFAQCLLYAGSIFGVGIYVQSKFSDLRAKLDERLGISPKGPATDRTAQPTTGVRQSKP